MVSSQHDSIAKNPKKVEVTYVPQNCRAISTHGYLLDYPLASYMGYSLASTFTGFGYSGMTIIGACSQGIFNPVTWVTAV